jgi:multisubunit Na+/H+ antiporter MnhC subunit
LGKKKSKKENLKTLDLVAILVKERGFLTIILLGFVLSAILVGFGQAAMWLGFFFAAYATVANDSIQSLGTFIESNQNRKWWILWLYIGGIFIVTVTFSWLYYDGDVTYQRLLSADGITEYPHPENFNYFQIIAPLILLILTRLRMPVSTTFLMLSVFSASSSGIVSVVSKSLSGYGMAFILSFLVWYFSYGIIRKYFSQRFTHNAWSVVQWIVSGALWAVWVMQDGANVAVFLPRQQTWWQFLIFTLTIFLGLGLLFFLKGDKIQKVVSEKARISDVRAATLIDLTYVILLIYKLFISTVPMSTTWVFLGVIGGREIAVNFSRTKEGGEHKIKSIKMIGKDVSYAAIGLFVSLALASGANPAIRDEIISYFVPGK